MRIVTLFVLVLSLFAVSGSAQEGVILPPEFRKVRWGMTPQQVKSAESAKLMKDGSDRLGYDTSLPGFTDVVLVYTFAENKLVRANYGVILEHTNDNAYIEDYHTVHEQLVGKYGKPASDDAVWKGDTFKDHPEDYGLAVATGELVYQTTWKTPSTSILLQLDGDNYKLHLGIQYTSRELGHLEDERKQTSDF